jgi:hypothetical protein
MSRRYLLTTSLATGAAFGFLTWLTLGSALNPHSVRPGVATLMQLASILAFPGLLFALLLSSNVHIVNIWSMVAGNFIFYSGGVYLALGKRGKNSGAAKEEK